MHNHIFLCCIVKKIQKCPNSQNHTKQILCPSHTFIPFKSLNIIYTLYTSALSVVDVPEDIPPAALVQSFWK